MKVIRLQDFTPDMELDLRVRELTREELAEVNRQIAERFPEEEYDLSIPPESGIPAHEFLKEVESWFGQAPPERPA